MADQGRFDRNIKLFGLAGQERIEATHVAIAGVGGLGSHVTQQLAYLGVRRLTVIDPDAVEVTNLNRLVGATPADAELRRPKVVVARRTALAVRPEAAVEMIADPIGSTEAEAALASADVLFGCLDDDAPRLLLTEVSSRLAIPYIDSASDAGEDSGFLWYGGRVVVSHGGHRCLSCCGELDQRALALAAMTPEQRAADQTIYGVDPSLLGAGGPSVVSVNGVVASLAVTEFLALVTGLREPIGRLTYYGHRGIVTSSEASDSSSNCYYCSTLYGTGR
ncbi:MAG: HesA/MoeB/ThiF family protein [Microthrixaceae bacterium]